jgi:hypothetical protein
MCLPVPFLRLVRAPATSVPPTSERGSEVSSRCTGTHPETGLKPEAVETQSWAEVSSHGEVKIFIPGSLLPCMGRHPAPARNWWRG